MDESMKKKELPEGLRKKQDEDRQKTIDKIDAAAKELKEERREINLKNLKDVAELSSGTWYKDHVQLHLLQRWGIGAKDASPSTLTNLDLGNLDLEEVSDLLKKVDDYRNRLASVEAKLKEQTAQRKKAENELEKQEFEKRVLRGELDIAMRRIRNIIGTKPKAKQAKIIALFESENDEDNLEL